MLDFIEDRESFCHPRTSHENLEGEWMYSCTLSLNSALDGVGGKRHASAALPPAKTRYLLYRRLGGPQGRSGRVRKISPHRNTIPGPSIPWRVAIPTKQNSFWKGTARNWAGTKIPRTNSRGTKTKNQNNSCCWASKGNKMSKKWCRPSKGSTWVCVWPWTLTWN